MKTPFRLAAMIPAIALAALAGCAAGPDARTSGGTRYLGDTPWNISSTAPPDRRRSS